MNNVTVIKRLILISLGIFLLTGATIHMQDGCKVRGADGAPVEKADLPGNGEFR